MTLQLQSPIAAPASLNRAALAHAQKNNLSIISAVAELVETELSQPSQQRFARLKAAIARIAALIDQDLRGQTFRSHPAAGAAPVPVDEVVARVHERLRDRADAAGVTLIVDAGGGTVLGDALALDEMLFNLSANAIEATPAGGTVFVTTHIDERGDQLWTIRDRGPGMRPEILRQIGSHGRTFRRGGSGFGVGLAAAIAYDHGGELIFDSTPGAGTLVQVTLRGVDHQPRDDPFQLANSERLRR
jgi:signal transduction histidine kinase